MSKIRIGVIPIVRGEYDAGTSYSLLNRVTSNGVMYESLVDGNVGNPLTDTSKWVRVSDNTSRVSFERVKLFDGDDTALLHYQNEINLNTEGSAGFSSFSAALAAVRTGLASLQGDKNILHAGFAFRFYNTTTQRMERWQLKVNGWSNNQSDWSRVATVDDIPAGGSGGTAVTIVDNLTSTSATSALSAKQGKALNDAKQDKLTAGAGVRISNNVISARPINAVYSMQNPTLSTMVADIMVLIQHSDVGTITVGAFASYSDGLAHEYMMQFTAGTATSLVLPASVKWAWEDVPAFTQGKTYQISIMNNLAMYAEF